MTNVKWYVKRPIGIQAMQYTGTDENVDEIFRFAKWKNLETIDGSKDLNVVTLEGHVKLRVGSYLLKGVKGEFYPCDEEIFNMTYQPVQIKEELS